MMKVVLIVLAFLNGEPSGKLPEVVYASIEACVHDWNMNADRFRPDDGSTLQVMCVSDHEVVMVPAR